MTGIREDGGDWFRVEGINGIREEMVDWFREEGIDWLREKGGDWYIIYIYIYRHILD